MAEGDRVRLTGGRVRVESVGSAMDVDDTEITHRRLAAAGA